jgi:hypothetical protein
MYANLLRQYREKLRAGTLAEPPNLEVLRPLKLLDRSALEHWLWAVDDVDLCRLAGIYEGEAPELPETLLLPHRIEPLIERLRLELAEAPPGWTREAPINYALALALDEPAKLRRLLVTLEVKARAGVESLAHIVMTPTARTRRISGSLVRALCEELPSGRGLRNAMRAFLTRPFGLRAGPGLREMLTPILAAELVEHIRNQDRTPATLYARLRGWLWKDGLNLRKSLLQLFARARRDPAGKCSLFDAIAQHAGQDDAIDDAACVGVLLRGFLETALGPHYEPRRWPPSAPHCVETHAPEHERLALRWTGSTGEASVLLDPDQSWHCRWLAHGTAERSTLLSDLELPELVAAALDHAGVRRVRDVDRIDSADLYRMPGVGSTGLSALEAALASGTQCGDDEQRATSIERLRRRAWVHLSEDQLERPLSEVAALPRPLLRDLDNAGFRTLGEVLQWSSEELELGHVLSPGRQVRLTAALAAHLGETAG